MIKKDRLERGAGGGERAGSLVEMMRCEDAAMGKVEDHDSCVGFATRCFADGTIPHPGRFSADTPAGAQERGHENYCLKKVPHTALGGFSAPLMLLQRRGEDDGDSDMLLKAFMSRQWFLFTALPDGH